MSTRLERSLDYATDPAALHAAFTDEQYWPARVAEVGGEGARVQEVSVTGEGTARRVRVVVVHLIGEDQLPPVVTAIRPGGLEIHRIEEWGPLESATCEGTFSADIQGVPARLSGTATLAGTDGGARITARGEASVSIPFVASKVESLVIENLQELMEREREFTLAWIADHSSA